MFLVCPPQIHWHFKFGELFLALFLHTYLFIMFILERYRIFLCVWTRVFEIYMLFYFATFF